MPDQSDEVRRRQCREIFVRMLGHLGRKEFDAFEACLTEDFVQEWPYKPLPSMPDSLSGARAVRDLIEKGMSDFTPYAYQIHSIHDLMEPDALIAEYSSHAHFRPRNVAYSNCYISVLRFRNGRICYWREYVNPLIIKEALLTDFDKSIDDRVGSVSPRSPAS
jgi:ketosteroid isomerase-like protein